ncbi:hypothetical protein BJ684DRAFT_20804 [Piptocephalis cylindrospora]|uniref:Peroxisome assembly protein 26 n=1 Tax=Piptocephalis cylindrospora TaxID=1907219 RepID=A0A4P9Y1N0_9FUNG|nr:hypothetical protein BJ684DRAFT_20804 [Piptocephalis cylindrospora]|eukprot:RKP12675.1 hypothetical protein BJ684DRAFT_20804 [Piptocephalis cylindrospora]
MTSSLDLDHAGELAQEAMQCVVARDRAGCQRACQATLDILPVPVPGVEGTVSTELHRQVLSLYCMSVLGVGEAKDGQHLSSPGGQGGLDQDLRQVIVGAYNGQIGWVHPGILSLLAQCFVSQERYREGVEVVEEWLATVAPGTVEALEKCRGTGAPTKEAGNSSRTSNMGQHEDEKDSLWKGYESLLRVYLVQLLPMAGSTDEAFTFIEWNPLLRLDEKESLIKAVRRQGRILEKRKIKQDLNKARKVEEAEEERRRKERKIAEARSSYLSPPPSEPASLASTPTPSSSGEKSPAKLLSPRALSPSRSHPSRPKATSSPSSLLRLGQQHVNHFLANPLRPLSWSFFLALLVGLFWQRHRLSWVIRLCLEKVIRTLQMGSSVTYM